MDYQLPWEVRLKRTTDRLCRQVDQQIQTTHRQLQECRGNMRCHREDMHSVEERRLEQSIQLLCNQLLRVQEAASRELQSHRDGKTSGATPSRSIDTGPDQRIEDAIQVICLRLQDIANSDHTCGIREGSSRTIQTLMRHAAKVKWRCSVAISIYCYKVEVDTKPLHLIICDSTYYMIFLWHHAIVFAAFSQIPLKANLSQKADLLWCLTSQEVGLQCRTYTGIVGA